MKKSERFKYENIARECTYAINAALGANDAQVDSSLEERERHTAELLGLEEVCGRLAGALQTARARREQLKLEVIE